MSTSDSTFPPAASVPAIPVPLPSARFVGRSGEFWRIVLRGAPLLLITLGIYRFWLTTDIRRFLWSGTQVGGEPFEYIGTARELLLGFLFAVAVLVPLYVGLFAASLAPGLGVVAQFMSVVAFLLLWVLGQYAIYRARRYRLTRTVYRGVRFTQTGSGFRYALCATFWSVLVILTFGLAYPFAVAALERFKLRHTFFGDLPGHFAGSGATLFGRGVWMWLLVMAPPLAAAGAVLAQIDWEQLGSFIDAAPSLDLDDEDSGVEFFRQLLEAVPDLETLGLMFSGAFALSLLLAVLLYPVFRALVLRWWASGVQFGEITAVSYLRTGDVYGTYAKFVGLAIALLIAGLVVFGVVVGALAFTVNLADSRNVQIALTIVVVGLYAALMLGFSALYQGLVQLPLWRLLVDSVVIANVAVLDRVSAHGTASSPFGEGLADALDVGGL